MYHGQLGVPHDRGEPTLSILDMINARHKSTPGLVQYIIKLVVTTLPCLVVLA